jgi:hypothetical protein
MSKTNIIFLTLLNAPWANFAKQNLFNRVAIYIVTLLLINQP